MDKGKRIVPEEYIGKKYGRLIILSLSKMDTGDWAAVCKCDCGTAHTCRLSALKRGNTNSCGCYKREQIGNANRIHGCRWTPTYYSWLNMRSRCNIKTSQDYKYYGGRGIKICDRWNDFRNFLEDVGEKPKGLTLDRIDNNGNYCKENCRWATRRTQSRNSRNARYVVFNGKTIPQHELQDVAGIPRKVISDRLHKLGWTPEEAATTPVKGRRGIYGTHNP